MGTEWFFALCRQVKGEHAFTARRDCSQSRGSATPRGGFQFKPTGIAAKGGQQLGGPLPVGDVAAISVAPTSQGVVCVCEPGVETFVAYQTAAAVVHGHLGSIGNEAAGLNGVR